jgi:exosome complex component RRP40
VATANKDIEPEIECLDPSTGKSAGYGELKGGYVIDGLSMAYCRRLLLLGGGVLEAVGAVCGFECAVGSNGRVWVDAGEVGRTVGVVRCVRETEGMGEEEMRKFVREVMANV